MYLQEKVKGKDLTPKGCIIRQGLIAGGVSREDAAMETLKFLSSFDCLCRVPFVRIEAGIYAVLARRAARGPSSPPNRGLRNDATMISTLLPHCDAMLVDRDMRDILRQNPLARDISRYDTRVFSVTTVEELYGYLDLLENEMTREHRDTLKSIYKYGENPRPYLALLDEKE